MNGTRLGPTRASPQKFKNEYLGARLRRVKVKNDSNSDFFNQIFFFKNNGSVKNT